MNITGNVTTASSQGLSPYVLRSHIGPQSHGFIDGNNLGFGLGKLARKVCTSFYKACSKAWKSSSNSKNLPLTIKHKIYRKGLEECANQCRVVFAELGKNPQCRSSLKKIKSIQSAFPLYLHPSEHPKFLAFQQQVFQALEEELSSDTIKDIARDLFKDIHGTKKQSSLDKIKNKFSIFKNFVQDKFCLTTKKVQSLFSTFVSTLKTINPAKIHTHRWIFQALNEKFSRLKIRKLVRDFLKGIVSRAKRPASQDVKLRPKRFVQQQSFFPRIVDLLKLDGRNGTTYFGEDAGAGFGSAISGGDSNNDTISDPLIGAPNAPSGGKAYSIWGSKNPMPASQLVANMNSTQSITYYDSSGGGYVGFSVIGEGDFNGDGILDRVIGAYFAPDVRGTAFVVFGRPGAWISPFDLASLDGSNGFKVTGILTIAPNIGFAVAAVDLTGDKVDELVLGSYLASPGGLNAAGSVFVILGKQSGWGPQFDLATINPANGFVLNGAEEGETLGTFVFKLGDINKDGFLDLGIGAALADPGGLVDAGRTYFLFGKNGTWDSRPSLAAVDGSNGTIIDGIVDGGVFGISGSEAGDFNADGIPDAIIGAKNVIAYNRTDTGAAYIILGQLTWPARFNLADGRKVIVIYGIGQDDHLGTSVSGGRDISGDGISDALLGAVWASPSGLARAGAAYAIFGRSNWSIAEFDLNTIDGTNGVFFPGLAPNDNLGAAVAIIGGMNGYSNFTILLGAPGANSTGVVYAIFGPNISTATSPTTTPSPTLRLSSPPTPSQIATSSSTVNEPSSITTPSISPPPALLSLGAIIGIATGVGVVVIGSIIVLITLLRLRAKKRWIFAEKKDTFFHKIPKKNSKQDLKSHELKEVVTKSQTESSTAVISPETIERNKDAELEKAMDSLESSLAAKDHPYLTNITATANAAGQSQTKYFNNEETFLGV